MFSNIDLGGIVIIIIIGLIICGIVGINRIMSGQGISIHKPTISDLKNIGKEKDNDTIPCFNIYDDKIKCESMLKQGVVKDARLWEINGRKYLGQVKVGGNWKPLMLPDDISYPPSRLARMMGCVPYKKLKSLKFSVLEQLAPFAPVIAIAILSILWIIVVG